MSRLMPAALLAFCFVCLSRHQGMGQTPPIAPDTFDTPVPARVIVPGPLSPVELPNRPLTASEAASIALRRGPSIAVARATVAAAQGRIQQVRSGLMPTVSVSGTYNHVESFSGPGGAIATTTTGTGVGSGGAGGTGPGSGGSGTGGTGGSSGTGTGSSGGSGAGAGTGGSGSGGTGTGPVTVTPLGASTTSGNEGFSFAATLRQLIFDFNHTRDLVRQAAALERAAAHDLNRVQADLVFQVKQAFYTYVEYNHLVDVNATNLANRQNQLALARARLNSGLGLPSDVATAETAVADAVLNLSVARNNADLARVNLAFLMGVDPRTPIQASETSESTFPGDDVNAMVNTALTARPEILEAQANVQATRYAVDAARTTNAPVISGNVQVGSRGTMFPPGNDTFVVGAAIQFNPFDGGLTAGLVRSARANESSAQAQLVNAQLTVTSDVTQAYFSLRTAEQRVATAAIEVANATEQVRIATGRYRSGLGLFLDIINAQAALVTARTNQVATLFSVDQARAAINRAVGNSLARQ